MPDSNANQSNSASSQNSRSVDCCGANSRIPDPTHALPIIPRESSDGLVPNSDVNLSRRGFTKKAAVGVAAGVAAGGLTGIGLPSSGAKALEPTNRFASPLGRRSTGDSIYKQQAIADYQQNMAQFGGQLAAPRHRLTNPQSRSTPWQFDVLIVGSGYGASITAARLAPRLRPGGRLGVLERGREWVPGTFPDRLPDVTNEARLKLLGPKKGKVNNPLGLFNVQQGDEITVLSGSGLGGSSLINASVVLRPDPDVFAQPVWPKLLQSREYLDPYYELAEYELGAAREPWDHTHKMAAQRRAGEVLASTGAVFEAAKLMITRSHSNLPVLNRQGMLQRGCIDCADCLTGCNVGAKNTLASNYLPIARRYGAEFFTGTEVVRVEKRSGYYQVHFVQHSVDANGNAIACPGTTTTRILVLGAGSVGSSEILMRSSSPSLALSNRLGCNWTGNGDALGFIRKSGVATGVAGVSAYPCPPNRVGPTIQTNLTYPYRNLAGRVLIQEGAAARSYANALGALMLDFDLSNVQILLGMGHDGTAGRIRLDEHGFGKVEWPNLLESPYRKLIRGEFQRVADSLGGNYRFLKIFGDRMISVHPLGGCGMSDDPGCGVVNHKCQVFDATHGGDIDYETGEARVHEGLYVIDGAVMPTSIACNPSLTISAIAERTADLLCAESKFNDLFTA